MGSRAALRNGAETLMVNLVHDRTYGAVRFKAEYGELSVVITRGIEVLALPVHANMVRPHAVHLSARNTHQTAVRQNAERNHAVILHGVEHAPVTRCNHIRGIVHLDLLALMKAAALRIHIKNCDAFCLSRIGVRSHIRHVFFHALSSLRPAQNQGMPCCFSSCSF